MLPTVNRLLLKNNNRKQFSQKVSSSEITILFSKKEGKRLKAGIVVSKKVAPHAVDRNRIKRMVRESLKNKLEIGTEMIIVVKVNLANLKNQEITEKINNLFEKII